MMASQSCPHLGLEYDPATYHAFPSDRNCCHKNRSPIFVELENQRQMCLRENHRECPIFLGQNEIEPQAHSFVKQLPAINKRLIYSALLIFFLGGLITALVVIKPISIGAIFSREDPPPKLIPQASFEAVKALEQIADTPTVPYLSFPLILHQPTLTPTQTQTPSLTFTPTSEPTQPARLHLRPTQIRRLPQPTKKPVKPTNTAAPFPTPPPFRPTVMP